MAHLRDSRPWRAVRRFVGRQRRQAEYGQGLVEYTLIAVFAILVLLAVLTTLLPALAGAFNNTLGAFDPSPTAMNPTEFWHQVTLAASYTPEVGSVSMPGTPVDTHAPIAVDDWVNTDVNTAINIAVLANDSDPDGDLIGIVAFDSTTAQGGTTVLHDNGTPHNPSDDYITYAPRYGFQGEDTFTYTISDNRDGTATATVTITVWDASLPSPTPPPSPTPQDIVHSAPYYDAIGQPSWWRLNAGAVFLGYEGWEVAWWAWSGSTTADVEAAMAGPPDCTTAQSYAQPINFYWGSGGPAPGGDCAGAPWRTDNFAVRWTRTFGLAEDLTVELQTVATDGIRVTIDGAPVSAISNWGVHSSPVSATTTHTFTGGVEHTIVVEYFEYLGAATAAFLVSDGSNDDVGLCNWTMSGEYSHTAPSAWSDFPGRDYYDNSRCHIALRGAVDLSTLGSAAQMTFWNRWRLNDYDEAWLQIREYGSGMPWYGLLLHRGFAEQLTWSREVIDLADYDAIDMDTGGPVSNLDWTGRTIEFRFLLKADASSTQEGWWIDDIAIEDSGLNVYTVGFEDNMESGSMHWLPEGDWTISSEYTRSGSGAWSDSPAAHYASNTNVSLQLDGVVDLTDPASVDPELVFYHRLDLGLNDRVYVEVSTDGETWVSLTPSNPGGALYTGTSNHAFLREEISLNSAENPYQGSSFFLRFRLEADGSDEGDGWWIDDVMLRNRPTGYLPYPFLDNVEAGNEWWLPEGTWNISPEAAHSGYSAWADSPGAQYGHLTDTSLQTARPFLLASGTAAQPELSFWHRRDLAAYDNFYVEVSTDDGATWTALWAYAYADVSSPHPEAPGSPGVGGVPLYEFNRQLAWEYVSIDMAAYIDVPFWLRFRLEALNDAQVADGVWIDDIQLAEHQESAHALPFSDDMEGTTNWLAGGSWALSSETVHAGSYAWADSPGGAYTGDSWSVLALRAPLDLTGLAEGDFPVLYWWDRFNLGQYDYARVQVSTWQGPSWSDWSAWTEVAQQYYTTTLSWNRHQVDLRPYIGQKIRLRFVLDALQQNDTGDGWWIDDVSVVLYNPQVIPFAEFTDNAVNLDRWIVEGGWAVDTTQNAGNIPATMQPGSWDAYFYDLRQYGVCGGDTDAQRAQNAMLGVSFKTAGPNCNQNPTLPFTPYGDGPVSLAAIDFQCDGSSSPHPDGTCNPTPWKADHDHMAIRFVSTIVVGPGESGSYDFRVTRNDGVRLFINPNAEYSNPILNRWSDVTPDTSTVTDIVSLYLPEGAHAVELWYYENGGSAVVQLDIIRPSFAFHDSLGGGNPPGGTHYPHQVNPSLILDAVLDMTGATRPVLSWFNAYDVADYDCLVAEVSLPYVRFDDWFEVGRRCGADQYLNWAYEVGVLRSAIEQGLGLAPGSFNFNGALLALRFRLDARVDPDTGDGWWLDDIAVSNPRISPVLECVTNNGNGTYTAHFGYSSSYNGPVTLPVGFRNYFYPWPADRGQPTVFQAGRQVDVFTVDFNGSNLVWILTDPAGNTRTATATGSSPACN